MTKGVLVEIIMVSFLVGFVAGMYLIYGIVKALN